MLHAGPLADAAPPLLRGRIVVVAGNAGPLGRAVAAACAGMGAEVHGVDATRAFDHVAAFYRAELAEPGAAAAVAAALPARIDALALCAAPAAGAPPEAVLSGAWVGPRLLAEALADRMPAGGAMALRAATPGPGWDAALPAVRAALTLEPADVAGFCARWNLAAETGLAARIAAWAAFAWVLRRAPAAGTRGLRLNAVAAGAVAPGLPAPPDHAAVADAFAFLLSDLGRAVHGACLPADGGGQAHHLRTLHGL